MIQQTHLNRKNTIQNRYREVSDLLRDGKWQKTPVFLCFYQTLIISRIINLPVVSALSPCLLLSHAISSPIDYFIAV